MTAATPLPCPFCGVLPTVRDINGSWLTIECDNHDCAIVVEVCDDTWAAALDQWNTRAPIPAVPQEPPTGATMQDTAVIAPRPFRWAWEDSK